MGLITEAVEADTTAAQQQEADKPTLIDMLNAGRDKYAAAMPPWMPVDMWMRDANTLLQNDLVRLHGGGTEEEEEYAEDGTPISRRDRSLFECNARSVLAALMTAAQLGLRPGVNGECWLQVKYSKKLRAWAASFEVGYKGLVKLAVLSGAVQWIEAVEVFTEDTFQEHKGTEPKIHHECARLQNPGEVERFYAVALLPNGHAIFTRSWSRERMEAFRAEYAANGRGPWWANEHTFVQMALKTMLKQLAGKRLPMTGELAEAIAADGLVRMTDEPNEQPSAVSVYVPEGQEPPPPGAGEESQEDPREGAAGDGGHACGTNGDDTQNPPEGEIPRSE